MSVKTQRDKLVILGKVWPEPASSAAGTRMMQLIDLFREQNWEIVFASAANDSEFMDELPGVQKQSILLNDASFDRFIREQAPSMVLFDRFTTEEQFGWRVAEQCPDAIRLLDTEDLHCLRSARQAVLKQKRTLTQTDLFTEIARREIASIYRCDLSLIISDYEIQLLKDVFGVPAQLVHYLPFLYNTSELRQTQRPFLQRQHFISIGNFLHAPNWDAVLFLKQEIWPRIRTRLPKAELHVYGAYPSHKVFELHQPREGFYIRGRAERVVPVMSEARVCLAPLRFGAGIKGKLVDAMICGTPSVTTPVGAESMRGDLPWGGCIAETAEELSQAAAELYSDEALWYKAQAQGNEIMRARYLKEQHAPDFLDKITWLQSALHAHRLSNFTGAMLMQHTAGSARYMALWIEAKNKLKTDS